MIYLIRVVTSNHTEDDIAVNSLGKAGVTWLGIVWPGENRVSPPISHAAHSSTLLCATSNHDEQYSQGAPRGGVEEAPQVDEVNDKETSDGDRNKDNGCMVSCRGCRKSFKTVKGLRIHQTRKGCMKSREANTNATEVQCNGNTPCETFRNDCPDKHHSTVDSSALSDSDGLRRPKIKWPASADKKQWKEVDKNLCELMEDSVQGTLKSKFTIFNNIIYSYGEEKFGAQNQVVDKTLSRRQSEIKKLRNELRKLRKQWKNAVKDNNTAMMAGLEELRNKHRSRLKTLRKAE